MNKSIFQYFTALVFLSLFSVGCSHDTDTFDGPFLVDRFGEFAIIDNLVVSQPTVDFAAGETVFFTATFNKNVNWIIEITGQESGAVKRIEGFDREITAANATWTGGTTDLPFFKAEMCAVQLLVPEEPGFSDTAEVETLSSKIYNTNLFTDFEQSVSPDLFIGNFEFEFTANTGLSNNMAAEGNSFLLLEGTDAVVPNFFVGLIDINASFSGDTYADMPTTVPEELYFNCFMYSNGGPHGIAIIDFVFDSNDSGAFEDGQDATFRHSMDLQTASWEGWQHVYYPMSETGISQDQLEKVVAIRLLLISDMNEQPNPPLQVSYGIDFINFTSGGPLEL
jgi:hypothetical protein